MAKGNKNVVAIGKFDGVHIGHQKLLNLASELAKNTSSVSVAYVINANSKNAIYTLPYREELIKNTGVQNIVLQDLTPDFMSMSASEFVSQILLEKLNCSHVVVGYNFRFAKNRSADSVMLKDLCQKNSIDCTIIPEVSCVTNNGEKVIASSTNVREFLKVGNIESANLILGRRYSISGKVVYGKQIGRTIGFPTANIDVPKDIILPKNGVYASKIYIGNTVWDAVANIGDNPTVNLQGNVTLEVNILDFSDDIYNKEVRVEFICRIRDEVKFNSLEELKQQINKDIKFITR